jgi:hypothetical protein
VDSTVQIDAVVVATAGLARIVVPTPMMAARATSRARIGRIGSSKDL